MELKSTELAACRTVLSADVRLTLLSVSVRATTAGMTKTQTPLLTKAQAAARAGVSEKTLDRSVKSGQLRPAGHDTPRGGGKLAPLFDPADVDEFRNRREMRPIPSAIPADNVETSSPTALSVRDGSLVRSLIAAVAKATTKTPAPVSLKDKMTLSTEEAAQLSGVPAGQIARARREGQLPAAKIGRGYRIYPDDLRAYVESLRPEATKPKTKRH